MFHGEGEGNQQLVNIGMEDSIDETDTGALVRVLIRELNMDLPASAGEGCYRSMQSEFLQKKRGSDGRQGLLLTLFGPLKPDVELLPRCP